MALLYESAKTKTKKMKKIFKFLTLVICTFIFTSAAEEEINYKRIVGEWVNPYTYENSGEFKGFKFKRNGKAEAINIPSLELKTWKIENGKLIVEGFSIDEETGERSEYNTSEKILKLSKSSLEVLALETPRAVFRYTSKKSLTKKQK